MQQLSILVYKIPKIRIILFIPDLFYLLRGAYAPIAIIVLP